MLNFRLVEQSSNHSNHSIIESDTAVEETAFIKSKLLTACTTGLRISSSALGSKDRIHFLGDTGSYMESTILVALVGSVFAAGL